MKKWKRIIGGALAGVLAVSTAVSALAAAEEQQPDTSLPQGVTQELLDEAVVNMDANAVNLLGMVGVDWNAIVSNKTVGEFIGTVNSLLSSIEIPGMPLQLNTMEIWAAMDRLENNPFDAYFDLPLTEIPLTELDYGVKDGDVDSFIEAIKDIFPSMVVMLVTTIGVVDLELMGAVTPEEPMYNGSLGQMLGVSLPEPLYRFALYPIYKDLGLAATTPDDATAQMMEIMVDAGEYDTTKVERAYNAAVEAKAEGAENVEELKAAYLEFAGGLYQGILRDMNDIYYGPIFDLVAQVLKAPLTTVVNLLPKLDAMIRSGEYGWLFDLLGQFLPDLFPADAAPATLVDLLNSVLANVEIEGAKLNLTLPAFNFAALDEMSMANRTMATVNYLTAALTTEENIAALTALIPAAGAILGTMDAETLAALVVNYLATGELGVPEEPSTDEPSTEEPGTEEPGTDEPSEPDPQPGTDDTDPETPSETEPDSQEPDKTEPDTETPADTQPEAPDTTAPAGNDAVQGGSHDVPDTGDAVIGMAVLAAVTAGGVIVFTRRKK